MSGPEWDAITQLFHAALERSQPDRDAFVAEACAGDAARLARVRRLLAAHDGAGAFLGVPAVAATLAGFDASEPSPVGTMIGRYRVVREIGRGGMGTVYLAERADDQFTKQVAIKLIARGMDTGAVLRRFRDERQILAELEHPHVARLLDAGTTADGRPYFVMEHVDGLPIDRYCDQHRLSVDDRLGLFLLVCGAVSYAHQRLVVHRDLKPSNVLVTDEGAPKLLDFGIAKVMRSDDRDTLDTIPGAAAMTPEYASPEQLRAQRVDAMSDVYSLGALLYALLVGRPPFATASRAPGELAQIIDASEPTAPSAAVMPSGGTDRLRRRLRGDVDTIVLKALARERERRYQSVEQLADDVRAHLEGRPIAARRAAVGDRALKFVRRNRVAVAAAAIVAATLVGGITATTWEAVNARRESRRADAQAAIAQAVSDFLQNDLLAQAAACAQVTPGVTPEPNLTVRAALDRAAARVEGRFASQPLVEAAVRQTIGTTYIDLGVLGQARDQLSRAVDLRRRTLGPGDPDTLSAASALGLVLHQQGDYAAAEALLTDVLARQRTRLGENNADVIETLNRLATTVSARGRRADGIALSARVVEIERRLHGDEHPDTLAAMNNLVASYVNAGRYRDAEPIGRQVVEIKRRTLGNDNPSTLMSMNSLGVIDRNLGKFADGEALLTETLERRRRITGANSPDTFGTMNSLANLYAAEGRYPQAESLLVDVVQGRTALYGDGVPDTVAAMNNLADVYRREGKLADADLLFRRVLETRRRLLGPTHANTLAVLISLGAIKLEQRQPQAAERLLRQAVAGYEQSRSDTWQRYYVESLLGESLAAQGRAAEAEPLLTAGYDGMMGRAASISAENLPKLDEVRRSIDALRARAQSVRAVVSPGRKN